MNPDLANKRLMSFREWVAELKRRRREHGDEPSLAAFLEDPDAVAAWFGEARPTPVEPSFWLVIVTYPSGRQIEVECMPDNRREARRVARYFEEERGALSAHVVKSHEWRSAA